MLEFLLFLFSAVGITNIVVNASILDYPRDFISKGSVWMEKLLSCMMCTGFWVGILIWLFNKDIYLGFGNNAPLCAAGTASLSSSFYDILTDYFLFESEECLEYEGHEE